MALKSSGSSRTQSQRVASGTPSRTYVMDQVSLTRLERLKKRLGLSGSALVRAGLAALDCKVVPSDESLRLDYGRDP